MNNKIVSTKTASAIFLAIVLVAGTIALSSSTSSMIGANVQAQPYYDDDKMNNDYNNYGYSDYRDDKKKYDDRYVPTDYYGINKDTYVTYSYEPEYPSSYEPNHKPKHSSYDKDDPPPSSPLPSEEPGATIGNGPLGITFDSNFETIYVTNQADDTVDVIDTDTDEVIDTISVGDGPAGIAHDSDNERMYVINIADDTVSVIDTATNEVIDTISVGDGPGGALGSSGPISILESLIRDDFIVWLDEQSQLHVTSTSP